MTTSIPVPIIFVDGLDVTLYRSIAAAEADLEPWIADDTGTTLADATGRRLTIAAKDGTAIRIELSEQGTAADDAEIKRLLAEALSAAGRPAAGDVPLRELIERGYEAGFGHP